MAAPTRDTPPGWVRAARRTARALRRAALWQPRHGWWAATAWVGAGALVALLFGVTTASVEGALGPHVTRYDVTTDATVTVDFGPLGTLEIDSPLPLTLGVRATVQEIPSSVTELGQARTLEALGDDLQAYVAFFTAPSAAVQDVAYALVEDALLRSVIAFAVLVTLWWTVRALLGPGRREELVAGVRPRARPATATAVAVVLGGTVLTSSLAPADRPAPTRPVSAVFAGTPLEGARVTGRLGGVIDTYGVLAVDAWRANEEFYDAADSALTLAWQDWEQDEQRRTVQAAERAAAERAARVTTPGSAAGGPEATPGAAQGAPADADPNDATSASPAPGPPGRVIGPRPGTPTPTQDDVEPVVLLVVSDLHCNVGMAPLIGNLAGLAGAAAVLDAGDTTMNGTSVEQYCVTSFARAVPRGVEVVTSPGNHDSAETTAHYADAGATVLDGHVVDVAGVRILGDRDPRETRVGAGGTREREEETSAQAARRLARLACDDGEVDLLLIHTPVLGDDALEDGCVRAQVSGHYHRRIGPVQVGQGVRLVSSSTAGATLNEPTVGPLRGPAEITVLRFDPTTRLVVDHQVVRVMPDATVQVGPRLPWPVVLDDRGDPLPGGALPTDEPSAARRTPTPTVTPPATPAG